MSSNDPSSHHSRLQDLPSHQAHLSPHGADGPYMMYRSGVDCAQGAVLGVETKSGGDQVLYSMQVLVDGEKHGDVVFRVDDTRRSTADILSTVKDLGGKFASGIDGAERIVGVTTRTPTSVEIFDALRGIRPSIVFESAGRFVVGEGFDFGSELCQQNFGFDRPQEDGEGLLLEIQMAVEDAIAKLK